MEEPVPVELLEKYVNGECSVAEVALVMQWYQSFEQQDDYVSNLACTEESVLRERVYSCILNSIDAEQQAIDNKPSAYRYLYNWYTIAGTAAAAILIVFGISFYGKKQGKLTQIADVNTQSLTVITNKSNQIYKELLPDNSTVWLKPHSQLTFPKVFAAKARLVSMSGECFFEVSKNPKRPFIIQSRSIITKVWGTSFLVRDDAKSSYADVSVLTGKVSVSVKRGNINAAQVGYLEKEDVMIYPHQKVVYLVNQQVLRPEINKLPQPELQPWNRVNLSFDNKLLSEIIPVLNSKYHVHIKAGREQLNHYLLNADMTGFNLSDVLEALKKSLNVSYQIKNNIIELE